MKPTIDVCVCTYKRPGPLRRTLEALFSQETGGRFDLVVHVVDNDAARSGEAPVREAAAAGHPVTYDVEPEQNIARARNRSVSGARGEYIAMTDDDELPDRRWLLSMLEAVEKFGADVVHGRMVQRFPPGTWRSVREAHAFVEPESGATTGYVPKTCNAFFRRSVLEGMPLPFDPAFGRVGGEDVDFFRRVGERGFRQVFCREAVVYTDVPPERATLRWVLRRRFRHGHNLLDLRGQGLTFETVWRAAYSMTVLLVTGSCWAVPGIVHRGSREKAADRFVRMLFYGARFAGRLARALNVRYEEYGPK